MRAMSADTATAAVGTTFLYWFIPGLALQFAMVSMTSALRGTGIVKPTMSVQALTVLLKVVLAPLLIAGWGTGRALAFAVAPVDGQNFGAREFGRVRQTLRSGVIMSCAVMLVLTIMCQLRAEWFIRLFSTDPGVVAVGTIFLQTSASRLISFMVPAFWLTRQPWFTLQHLWYLSIGSVGLQAIYSLILVRREFRLRLQASDYLGSPAYAEAK